MEIVLAVATVLGGIAAAWFFWDKLVEIWRSMRGTPEDTQRLAPVNDFDERVPNPVLARQPPPKLATELSAFITEGQQLRARLDENPLPIREHNEWVDRVGEFLKENVGVAYEVRLNDFSGMTFYGDGTERSNFSRSIEGRLRRLHEFISEIAQK